MTPPSNFALRIIVEEDRKLVQTLNANYAGAAPDGGLDTSERDALFDFLGSHFTGRRWPRSGGTEATRRYLSDLQHAMIARRLEGQFLRRDRIARVCWLSCHLPVIAMWRALIFFALLFIVGCQHRRPDFMTRVMEDCAAGDQWACDLLDSLAKARMGRDSIRLEDAHGP